MQKEKVAEIIAQLRIVRKEKEYSYQKIADMTEEIGESVSLSTVKRVFTESGNGFRWATIKPIATVLLGVGFETPEPDHADPNQPNVYYAEIEALKALVEAKAVMVEERDRAVDYLRTQLKRQQILGVVLAAILIALIAVDFFNHTVGFFWLG